MTLLWKRSYENEVAGYLFGITSNQQPAPNYTLNIFSDSPVLPAET